MGFCFRGVLEHFLVVQILVSLRVFGMESHYICPKNVVTMTTQKSPSRFSLSLSHIITGVPQGFNFIYYYYFIYFFFFGSVLDCDLL